MSATGSDVWARSEYAQVAETAARLEWLPRVRTAPMIPLPPHPLTLKGHGNPAEGAVQTCRKEGGVRLGTASRRALFVY